MRTKQRSARITQNTEVAEKILEEKAKNVDQLVGLTIYRQHCYYLEYMKGRFGCSFI